MSRPSLRPRNDSSSSPDGSIPPSPTLRHTRNAAGVSHFTFEYFTSTGVNVANRARTGLPATWPASAAQSYSSFNAANSRPHLAPPTGRGLPAPRRRQSSQSDTSSPVASAQPRPRPDKNVKNSR
jgi:hypothetical protein